MSGIWNHLSAVQRYWGISAKIILWTTILPWCCFHSSFYFWPLTGLLILFKEWEQRLHTPREFYHEFGVIYTCICLKMSRLTSIMSQFSQFYICWFFWKTDVSFLICYITYYNSQTCWTENWKEIIKKNLKTGEKKSLLLWIEIESTEGLRPCKTPTVGTVLLQCGTNSLSLVLKH